MPADSQIGDYEIRLASLRITPQPESGIPRFGARPLLAAGKLIGIPPARPPKNRIEAPKCAGRPRRRWEVCQRLSARIARHGRRRDGIGSRRRALHGGRARNGHRHQQLRTHPAVQRDQRENVRRRTGLFSSGLTSAELHARWPSAGTGVRAAGRARRAGSSARKKGIPKQTQPPAMISRRLRTESSEPARRALHQIASAGRAITNETPPPTNAPRNGPV